MNAASAETDILSLADELRGALLRASRQLRREAQKAGVSALDAQLLGILKKNPGLGVSELADREQMARPSMSGHVKRLEAAGWVARAEADAEDRRRVGLTLTAKGAKALEAIRRRRNDWLAERLSGMPPSARQALEQAIGPLKTLAGDR